MRAVIVGPDRGLGDALASHGLDVVRVEGLATGATLDDAGVDDASMLVVTDVDEATAIPVAKDRNPDLRVIVYAPDSMPEFVRGQVDLAVAPTVLDAGVIAEELLAGDD